MTTRAEELAQQERWKLKPAFASWRAFEQMVENEFKPPADQEAEQARALRAMVEFAARQVPYYSEQWARLGVRAEDIDHPRELARLPVLTRHDVIGSAEMLKARKLPAGHEIFGAFRSSGTTGRPVVVFHTVASNIMFTLMRQRHARWYGLDPARGRVEVRAWTEQEFRQPDGASNMRNVVRMASWRHLGKVFETGPEWAFHVGNPMEQQIEWLRELRPQYAMSYPGIFEEWLMACEGRPPVDSLEVIIGIGTQLSASLRNRLERDYQIPVHEGYGLNEIGIVAPRCSAGRFHANTEHCLVEIVREDGQLCAEGETGRLLVTGLQNHAMPLFRYDTGDVAEAVAGPCPCGRTLPSFGPIAGRYRRYVGLPAGTRERLWALLRIFEEYPPAEMTFLRQYQVHQSRDNRFTLRLRTVGPIPEAFRAAALRAWAPVAGDPPMPLEIAQVEAIAASPSGKVLDFASECYADAAVQSK